MPNYFISSKSKFIQLRGDKENSMNSAVKNTDAKIKSDLIYYYKNGSIKNIEIPKFGEVTFHYLDGRLERITKKETIK